MTVSQKILMCPPDFFEVAYVINPWMEGNFAKTDEASAREQWLALRDALAKHAEIAIELPQRGLPDIVFTANAGLVSGDRVILSRFRSHERQGEEPFNRAWFTEHNFNILDWPQEVPFEGAGDALFDRGEGFLWVGHGFRTDASVPARLETMLGCKTVPLTLADPRFYHLDTCLCPLDGGYVLYFPQAFTEAAQATIEALVAPDKRIAVDEEDALRFCCNAVDLGGHVFMNDASEALQNRLRKAGFTPVIVPLSEFLKAGGGAKCLTLKLVEP